MSSVYNGKLLIVRLVKITWPSGSLYYKIKNKLNIILYSSKASWDHKLVNFKYGTNYKTSMYYIKIYFYQYLLFHFIAWGFFLC